jgi:hypothetical protein
MIRSQTICSVLFGATLAIGGCSVTSSPAGNDGLDASERGGAGGQTQTSQGDAAAAGTLATGAEAKADAAEEAVYAAVLKAKIGAKSYVIEETTSTGFGDDATSYLVSSVKRSMTRADAKTVASLKSRNLQHTMLRANMTLGVPYVLVSSATLSEIFASPTPVNGGWDIFYQKYPDSDGLVALSRVGFNAAMNQALVYVEHSYADLGADGNCYLVQNVDGDWSVTQEIMLWIS